MDWISSWIQGIMISVIVGTIIEMILPEGNCKKYIKVVIGVYILFSVVSPVITKITGNEFRVSDIYDINTYIEVSSKASQNIEINQESQIKQVYVTNFKSDMKQKIEEKGYNVKNISLEIANDEQYTITKINIQLSKNEEKNNQVEVINEINITIGNQVENEENISISINEQNELKEYLNSVYNVDEQYIFIN